MKISYRWLLQYITLDQTVSEISDALTQCGLEVESVTAYEPIKGSLEGIVIGSVRSCEKHPNADKLSLTSVDVGGKNPLAIVCGAANVAVGQKVLVALPGTTLYPYQGEPFFIKKSKIRGEISEGMICAEDEIGLSDRHDGIIVLDTELPNGTAAGAYFHIEKDYIFEIGLTPNRADAASHIGVARDLKAVFRRPFRLPDVSGFRKDDDNFRISISVENTEACPRYAGVTLTQVTVGESPYWLKKRLESIGLTPINNVVDVTNFVLHETGQPLHAFDADRIRDKKILVKNLPSQTAFVTLDGKERKLSSEDLMVCDTHGGLCIAGVFGGIVTGVTNATVNVFLESAYFHPHHVRKTALHHQLKTDASFRFERGADPNMTIYALKRAACLIKEIAQARISSDIVDEYPTPIPHRSIGISIAYIHRLIGKKIPTPEIIDILTQLDIGVHDVTDTSFVADVPPYRVDVTQPADLVEEILRIYGFNNIQIDWAVGTDFLAQFPVTSFVDFKRELSGLLTHNGFYEIISNSLTHHTQTASNGIEPVVLLNSLSEGLNTLRTSLLFNGLDSVAYNLNRKQRNVKFFEFGKIYAKANGKFVEENFIGFWLTGNALPESWQHSPRKVTYYDVAQHVSHLLAKSGIKEYTLEKTEHPHFTYAVAIKADKQHLGLIGKTHPRILADLGIKQEVLYAEINTDKLFARVNPELTTVEISKFPEVRRDLSLVLDKKTTFADILKAIRSTESRLVKDVFSFDVYEGKNLPNNKKAYALGFILWHAKKTLTDAEIDAVMQKLIETLEQKMGAVIRK